MASTKSLEDMLLSSDIDESAVSALVGSLESQLSSSDAAHYPRNQLSNASINNNHATVADCAAARLPDVQPKHGALLGSLLEQSNQNNSNKGLVSQQNAPQQLMSLSSAPQNNLSNTAVIVSLPGALPASGYLNQVSSAQGLQLNNSVSSRLGNVGDIKLVYSPHSTSSPFTTSTGVITTNNRNNFKQPLHNGSVNFNNGVVVSSSVSGPVLSSSQQTQQTLQNLANIASQQPRLQVINSSSPHLSAVSGKNPPPRNPGDVSKAPQSNKPSSPILSNHYQVQNAASVITSKPNHLHSNVNVQVVTNPNMLHPGVQILNVNATRFGQKTLAPRGLVVGNQVRIAPQLLRQGTPIQVPGQSAISLPPGMRSALVVRADGSQYHVFNVPPAGLQAGSANAPNATYRLQSVQGGVPSIIRTLSHPQVVSVPVSSAGVKTLQTGPTGMVRTITPQQITVSTQALTKPQQAPHAVVSTVLQQTTTAVARTTQSETMPARPSSPNSIMNKCQKFLSTLIRLAGGETSKTASNVKKIIQNLIDGTIEPEEFSTQLQKELQSSRQPHLIHFLKKSLPLVRQALINGEMTIEGIRPPPLPVSMQAIAPASQVGNLRPVLASSARNIVTSIGGSALTAQLSQPPGSTILTQRLVSSQVPQTITRPLRPLSISSTGSGLVESSPATVGALQSKVAFSKQVSIIKTTSSASKEKKAYVSVRDEDDINDVAAMGGVNLLEESQRILATNSELIGSQIRSCKDDNHFLSSSLHRRILQIAKKHGLEEVRSDVIELVSHAAEKRLKGLIEKLSISAEHRCENPKCDPRYEVTSDTKAQVKFLEELDRLEKKRHDDQEKEMLLKAAKSRSKLEDPELLKLKAKAKEMQRAEMEEMRQKEANSTALMAIGPRKKPKLDLSISASSQSGSDVNSNSSTFRTPVKSRVKRVNLRDLLFIMENEYRTVRRPLLYKYYAR